MNFCHCFDDFFAFAIFFEFCREINKRLYLIKKFLSMEAFTLFELCSLSSEFYTLGIKCICRT